MFAVDMLEDAGLVPLEANDAAHGLEQLAANPLVRVVLTDINMPGDLDGVDFATVARRKWPNLDFVFVSGAANLAGRSLPDRSVFFQKPYNSQTVVEVVRRFLTD